MKRRHINSPEGYIELGDRVVSRHIEGVVTKVPYDREIGGICENIEVRTATGTLTLQDMGSVRVTPLNRSEQHPEHYNGKQCVLRVRGTHRYIRNVGETEINTVGPKSEEGGYLGAPPPPPVVSSGEVGAAAVYALPGLRNASLFALEVSSTRVRIVDRDGRCLSVVVSLPFTAAGCCVVFACIVMYLLFAPFPRIPLFCALLCVQINMFVYVLLCLFEGAWLAVFNQNLPLSLSDTLWGAWVHQDFTLTQDGRVASKRYPKHQLTVDPNESHKLLLTKSRPGHAFDIIVV